MEEININEIVKVESIGVIKQQLDKVEEIIDEKVKDIPKQLEKIKQMSFNEQEDAKGDIKKYKQYLSNLQKQLEEKRKEIHNEIEKPYNEFNEYYSNGVYKKLDNGITQLKDVINEIEDLQKDEKKCELELFARQHFEANNIDDIVSFDDIGLNITLSASISSLKEQVLAFVEKINNDLKLIELEEYKDEILLEYKNNIKWSKKVDFAQSKLNILTRKKQLEEIQKKQKEIQLQIDDEAKIVEKVEEITTPKEIIEDDEVISVTFTITDTKENILKVRDFMKKEGIKYE